MALDENGQYHSIATVNKKNVQRRQTLKEIGVSFPDMSSAYPGVTQVGWMNMDGTEVTEDTAIVEPYFTVYAKYDKGIFEVSYKYPNSNGEWSYAQPNPIVYEYGTTYGELMKTAREFIPDDLMKDYPFSGWEYSEEWIYDKDEIVSGSQGAFLIADFEGVIVLEIYRDYYDQEGRSHRGSEVYTVTKGTKQEDVIKQLNASEAPTVYNGLRFKEWDSYAYLGDFGTAQNGEEYIMNAVYDTYADYALANKMARTRSNVDALLRRLKDAYMPVQRAEVDAITDFARVTEGDSFVTRQWDYAYYSRLYRISRYDYDPESMRPYFKLDTTVKGVFGLARTLYGIDFVKRHDIPVYHPDVEVYEVKDIDGSHLGLLYMDFFPRDGKRAGAWMTDFREQSMLPDGSDVRPHVSIVTNFTRPTSSTPALLSPNEVNTLLHEFGHALHSLFSRCRYAALSGTNVARDFVELPSQFNENFMRRREFLDTFARHYQTGEPLPDEAVEKMVRSSQFGCGYDCIRQLMFGLTDMAWHTVTEPVDDPVAFELSVTDAMAAIPNECRSVVSPSFGHIFSGGYAAGYYSYKWAEVIEADAFGRFLEEGVTNRRTAESFRLEILEKGATDEPDELYRRFRGRDPEPEALLRRDGVIS